MNSRAPVIESDTYELHRIRDTYFDSITVTVTSCGVTGNLSIHIRTSYRVVTTTMSKQQKQQIRYQLASHHPPMTQEVPKPGQSSSRSTRTYSFETSGGNMTDMEAMIDSLSNMCAQQGMTIVSGSSSSSSSSSGGGGGGGSYSIGPVSSSAVIQTSLPGGTPPSTAEEIARIHKDGNADVSRFTTENFGMCHRHLSDSLALGRSKSKNDQTCMVAEEEENKLKMLANRIMTTVLQAESYDDPTVLMHLRELSAIGRVDRLCPKFADVATQLGYSDFFATVWLKLNQVDIKDQIKYPGPYIAVNLLLDGTQRFTEINHNLCRDMGRRCVPALLTVLADPFYSSDALNGDNEQTKWMSRVEFLKKIFAILFNCARNYQDNRNIFRRFNASSYLKTFLNSRFFALRTKALMILSYIVTEEENAKLNESPANVKLAVDVLGKTLSDDPSRTDHYSAQTDNFAAEVVESVQRLATSDDNKKALVDQGVLPHLVSLMDGWDEERNASLDTLWQLSFHPDNKDVISRENGCMDAVKRCMADDNSSKQCKAILWNLGVLSPESISKQTKDNALLKKAPTSATTAPTPGAPGRQPAGTAPTGTPAATGEKLASGYVMISYQWDVQPQILEVNKLLKANGYSVWIDVEQMGGSTLEAMAGAVENAGVIIICFSEKYKDSPACRTEAEYAYKLRKPVVPLKMQKGYDANGWLGAMLGTKLWIEMFALDLVDKNGHLLLRELAGRGRTGPPTSTPPSIGDRDSHADLEDDFDEDVSAATGDSKLSRAGRPPPWCSNEVLRWHPFQVIAWLDRNGSGHLVRWFRDWTGEDLLGLKEMARDAPAYFYTKLETEFGLATVQEQVRVKTLLNKIV